MKIHYNNTKKMVIKIFPQKLYEINSDGFIQELGKSSFLSPLVKISGWHFDKPIYVTVESYMIYRYKMNDVA